MLRFLLPMEILALHLLPNAIAFCGHTGASLLMEQNRHLLLIPWGEDGLIEVYLDHQLRRGDEAISSAQSVLDSICQTSVQKVWEALLMLASLDAAITQNAYNEPSKVDPYRSLLLQKEGVVSFLTSRIPGYVPVHTTAGYVMHHISAYFEDQEEVGRE